jgi:isoaspartyl peptidase/L-asparaginase-like protein (Ntn-hydrolase superfamily)
MERGTRGRGPPCLVAVHVGAGWHSAAKEPAYKRLMADAIAAALAALRGGGASDVAGGSSPLDAVVAALSVLEVRDGLM